MSTCAVLSDGGQRLGYVAREIARILAPLMDQPDPPVITPTLTQRSAEQSDRTTTLAAAEGYDAIVLDLVIAPPGN